VAVVYGTQETLSCCWHLFSTHAHCVCAWHGHVCVCVYVYVCVCVCVAGWGVLQPSTSFVKFFISAAFCVAAYCFVVEPVATFSSNCILSKFYLKNSWRIKDQLDVTLLYQLMHCLSSFMLLYHCSKWPPPSCVHSSTCLKNKFCFSDNFIISPYAVSGQHDLLQEFFSCVWFCW